MCGAWSSQRMHHWSAEIALNRPLSSENARLKNEDVIRHWNRIFCWSVKIALALPLSSENARMTSHKSKNVNRRQPRLMVKPIQNHMFLQISGVAWGRLGGQGSRPNAPGQDPYSHGYSIKTTTPKARGPTRLWARGPANLMYCFFCIRRTVFEFDCCFICESTYISR